jgi:hypothetical protein
MKMVNQYPDLFTDRLLKQMIEDVHARYMLLSMPHPERGKQREPLSKGAAEPMPKD